MLRRLAVLAVIGTLAMAAGLWPGGRAAAQDEETVAPEGLAGQTAFQPVATVNDDVITAFDLDQRMRLMTILGAQAPNNQALASQALDELIEDKLRLQAGEREGLAPNDETFERGVNFFASQLELTPESFVSAALERGVTRQAIDDMVSARVIWREVVTQRFLTRIEPGEAEIDAEIALANQRGRTAYRLREIGLPNAENGRGEAATEALAERLYRELSAGGDFVSAVDRHSRAPSRAEDGMIGWVMERDLPPQYSAEIAPLEVGGVTRPLPVPGGFTLLQVADKRVEEGGGLDPADPELRERVRESLTARRLERLAQGLLQELRRDALIEVRR